MRDLLTELLELLGAQPAGAGAGLRLEALQKRTRQDLLAAAKKLGLGGVSKLQKKELAQRVLEALKARMPPRSEPHAAPGAETLARKTKTRAAPARTRGSPEEVVPASANATGRPRRNGVEATAPAVELEPAAAAKLDLGPAARGEAPVEHIPWSYGVDRITAAPVDPDKLYVYWEVTDPAVERARAGLGPGGAGAWLSLRVYDTTDLIFDGTNAHSYFDHGVERSDRQWFFTVGKPSSTAFVEIGMKSGEGFFVKIARSNRVDFPGKGPPAWREPEWVTVLPATGEVEQAGTGAPSRAAGGPPPGGESPSPFAPIPLWWLRQSMDREVHIRELLEGGWERVEWREAAAEGWFELLDHVEWQGPLTLTTWQAGPFAHPVEVRPPEREEWQGRSFAFKVGQVTHVVYGPWQVVIRNLGPSRDRAVVARWEIYRWWETEGGEARMPPGRGLLKAGASELAVGASERLWLAASELRLGGASEVWRLGASEVRLRGASERLLAGASQRVLRGASERHLLGASEVRLAGASERMLGGASEQRLGGASERLGASERRLGGASERVLGGASEQRFEGDSAAPPAGAYPEVAE